MIIQQASKVFAIFFRPPVLSQVGAAHRPWRHEWRGQGLPQMRHQRHHQGGRRQDPAQERAWRGWHRGQPPGAGGGHQLAAEGQVHSEGVQGGWAAEDELVHNVKPKTRIRGPDQGPGQSLCPGLICRTHGNYIHPTIISKWRLDVFVSGKNLGQAEFLQSNVEWTNCLHWDVSPAVPKDKNSAQREWHCEWCLI